MTATITERRPCFESFDSHVCIVRREGERRFSICAGGIVFETSPHEAMEFLEVAEGRTEAYISAIGITVRREDCMVAFSSKVYGWRLEVVRDSPFWGDLRTVIGEVSE